MVLYIFMVRLLVYFSAWLGKFQGLSIGHIAFFGRAEQPSTVFKACCNLIDFNKILSNIISGNYYNILRLLPHRFLGYFYLEAIAKVK